MKTHIITSFLIAVSAFVILATPASAEIPSMDLSPKELAEVAKISNGDGVGVVAVVKLNDQKLLADVACNANAENIRNAAVAKITDQALLADVAKNGKNYDIRIAAIKKLTEQALLADVACWAYDKNIGNAAIEKLTDQALLADVANKTWVDVRIREAARKELTKLTNQREQIPLTGDQRIQGAPNATDDTGIPQIDLRRPQPRPHLAKNVRPAIHADNKIGTPNIGVTGIDAKWSNYGAYLQKLIDTVQVQWDDLNDRNKIFPPTGTKIMIKFRLDSEGKIAEIIDADGNGGTQAANICKSAITDRAPYGKWSDQMIAVLGDSQEMTFTFYYGMPSQ